MPNVPERAGSVIAASDTYVGQSQPIGGAANTATPPLVTVTNPSPPTGFVSVLNSTNVPLGGGATFTGAWEDVSQYSSISVIGLADVAGTLYLDFSADGATTLLTAQATQGLNGSFGAKYVSVRSKYFRIRIINGVAAQASMQVQTIYESSSRTNQIQLANGVDNYTTAETSASAIYGQHDNELVWDKVQITETHALKVSITDPLNAFGEFVNTPLTPTVQVDAVYGIRSTDVYTLTSGTGTATAQDSKFRCSTGAGVGAYGVIRSVRLLKYYDGQGVRLRGTAKFTAGVAQSFQAFGMFTAADGIFFGYDNATFGIIRRIAGAVEIKRLTVTVGAGAGEVITITLNGVPFILPATPAPFTENETAQYIAYNGSLFTGWYSNVSPTSNGATVTFLQNVPAVTGGAFTLASSGVAAGNFTTIQAGSPNTNSTTPQASFNVDTLDGTGGQSNPSGMLLNKQKLNVYQVIYPYLGAGPIRYYVVNPSNARMTLCHIEPYANNNDIPSQKNPSFRAGWISASLGSSTDLVVEGASAAGFIEGPTVPNRNPESLEYTANIGVSNLVVVAFRIRSEFAGVVNQAEVLPIVVGCSVETSNRIVSFSVLLNPVFGTGTFNWQYVNQTRSIMEYATPTGITVSNGQPIASAGASGNGGETLIDLKGMGVRVQAGDVLAIVAHTVSSTSNASFAMTWQEN